MTIGMALVLCAPGAGHTADELADAVECRERAGLPNFFAKLKRGGNVRIGYLGGSITAQDGWRPKSRDWFQQKYPGAKVEEINAAIGGTGSDLGVFRLRRDVLDAKPDLLFVEFAVNDGGAPVEQIHRCMEGIVRQTWNALPETDTCFVYTVHESMLRDLQAGKFPRSASAMETVAEHYGIPTIHMALEVARLEKEGKLVFKGAKPKTDAERAALGDKILFSPDGVHPYTDAGHQLYLEAVARSMEKLARVGRTGRHSLGEPLRVDNWEGAALVPLNTKLLQGEWTKLGADDPVAKRFSKRLPELWKASRAGASITVRFRGTALAVYDIVGPDCGQVEVSVDGKALGKQARFDAYCTYHRLAKLVVAADLSGGEHTAVIRLLDESPDKAAILSKRNEKIDDPARYAGLNWYAGALLVVGEVR
ncbi:MAG TPA: GDSL-type esterase/lipase family protein [Verrucomicrobiae bacterium]|nr:GDSL-type esterase/lipase family protein [Verrucomicrobiae bacterium]